MIKMLCQACNKNNAAVHYKTNINGVVKEKYLCRECAEKHGAAQNEMFPPIDVMDGFFGKTDDIFGGFFAGMMGEPQTRKSTEHKACPMCGMRYSEFLHEGKIGCSKCYETFAQSLGATIKRIHTNSEHLGKVPEGIKSAFSDKRKIDELRKKLNGAIEAQEYEMAAKYRDEIRELENKGGEVK